MEDILGESLEFLGGEPVVDDEKIAYGPLQLTVAPKEGKANTLLADHLFSPALFIAERIERGLIPFHNCTVIELGCGTGLPSLLMATSSEPPAKVLLTDYPDDAILGNLERNVGRNQHVFTTNVEWRGYEWGQDVSPLLQLLSSGSTNDAGYDIVILSDLLHFGDSHTALISSVTSLLAKCGTSRVYVAAGKYTHAHVCENFLWEGRQAGLHFTEEVFPPETKWLGTLLVSGLDSEQLAVRKNMCRWWVGGWIS